MGQNEARAQALNNPIVILGIARQLDDISSFERVCRLFRDEVWRIKRRFLGVQSWMDPARVDHEKEFALVSNLASFKNRVLYARFGQGKWISQYAPADRVDPFISILRQLPNLKDLTIMLPEVGTGHIARIQAEFNDKPIRVPFLTIGWGEFPSDFLSCVDPETLVGIKLAQDDFTRPVFAEVRQRFPNIERLGVCIRDFIKKSWPNMKDMPALDAIVGLEDTLRPELYEYINKSFPALKCLSAMAPEDSDNISKFKPAVGTGSRFNTDVVNLEREIGNFCAAVREMKCLERLGLTLGQHYAIHQEFWSGVATNHKHLFERTNWIAKLDAITYDQIPPGQVSWYEDVMRLMTSGLPNLLETVVVVNDGWMIRATRKNPGDIIAPCAYKWVKITSADLLSFPFTNHNGHLRSGRIDVAKKFIE